LRVYGVRQSTNGFPRGQKRVLTNDRDILRSSDWLGACLSLRAWFCRFLMQSLLRGEPRGRCSILHGFQPVSAQFVDIALSVETGVLFRGRAVLGGKAPSMLRFAGALQGVFGLVKRSACWEAFGFTKTARGDARPTSFGIVRQCLHPRCATAGQAAGPASIASLLGTDCQVMYYSRIFVSLTLTNVWCRTLTR